MLVMLLTIVVKGPEVHFVSIATSEMHVRIVGNVSTFLSYQT